MKIIPRYDAIQKYESNMLPLTVAIEALDVLTAKPNDVAVVIEAADFKGDTIVTMRNVVYREARKRGIEIRTFKGEDGSLYLHT